MKVRLKRPSRLHRDLTAGNVYRVIGIEADHYRLMNDFGRPYLYSPRLFELIDAARPRDWQQSRGDQGEEYAYPPELGKPGFFEDYFDGVRRAILALHAYLDRASRPDARRRARSA